MSETNPFTRFRDVELHAPTGSEKSCKGWVQEAALRMLYNNLDPAVAENPRELVVYGGIGRAARNVNGAVILYADLKAALSVPLIRLWIALDCSAHHTQKQLVRRIAQLRRRGDLLLTIER